MPINPIRIASEIEARFRRYLSTTFAFPDIHDDLREQFADGLEEPGRLFRGPYLHGLAPYVRDLPVTELVKRWVLPVVAANLLLLSPIDRPLYWHQVRAIERLRAGRNVVVSSGTSSGKTLSFLAPILASVLEEPRPGVQTLLLYPMNALVNDQLKNLRRVLRSVPQIRFGRYINVQVTPQTEREGRRMHLEAPPNEVVSREVFRQTPPHLLITNYAMHDLQCLRQFRRRGFSAEASDAAAVVGTRNVEKGLYRVFQEDSRMQRLREAADYPRDLRAASTLVLGRDDSAAVEQLCGLVRISSLARVPGGDARLVPCRYHLFVRGLNGAYVALGSGPDRATPTLFLESVRETEDGRKAFELRACRTCGQPYLYGITASDSGGATLTPAGTTEGQPHALAVSPDGKWAAVGGNAGNGSGPGPSLRLADLARNRKRPVHRGDMSYVNSVAFSPDARLLAAGSIDLHTRLFEVVTGREVLTLTGHERTVAAVSFMPGGRVLATADGGPESRYWKVKPGPRTLRFWDVGTGKELARLEGHASEVTSLDFSKDGTRLVAGLSNGTALVWKTPDAVRLAIAPAGRKLGPKELAALWGDLAGDDAHVAHEAVRILAASPEQTVPFLVNVLRAAPKLDAAKLRRRIADLGNEEYTVREAASRELARWGEDIEPELVKSLKGQSAPEVVRRVEALRTEFSNSPPAERRREMRGVWVLELAGGSLARKLLADLARGESNARLTREAKAAAERIRKPRR